VEIDAVKITRVAEWPTLESKKEVQSFLGFTNFYCQFIERFSLLVCPLSDLIQNESKWDWDESEHSAFEAIRDQIISALILMFPDNFKPF
jgi:hypothetical protein